MKCNGETLIALVLGDLTEDQERDVRTHITECQSCARRLEELQRTTALLDSLPEADRRPLAMERLWEEIEKPETPAERPTATVVDWAAAKWRWGVALAAAACFVFLSFSYGTSFRIGEFEIAWGPQQELTHDRDSIRSASAPSVDPEILRAMVRGEINSQVRPALLSILGAMENMDTQYQNRLVTLENDFARKRAFDRAEIQRNFRLLANTVDESFSARPVGYRPPVMKIDEDQ